MSMKTKIAVLAFSLCVAFGPWISDHATELFNGGPERLGAIGEALGIFGGVMLAWLGRSPIPREPWTESERRNNGKP